MISFIVLTYNSERTIQKCLESISAQRCEKEIIVVDGGSKDRTAEIAKKQGAKIVTENRRCLGLGTARNAGMEHAKGEYIAFVDSDVVLPEGWISIALEKISKNRIIAGVGGPGISPEKGRVSDSLNFLYGKSIKTKESYVKSLPTMDLLYKRDTIKNQKFLDYLKTTEDVEFNFRLVKSGYKLLFSSDLYVYHYHPANLRQMIKKWYNYGRNYAKPYMIHREMIDKIFMVRVLYLPFILLFTALSIFNQNLLLVPLLQIIAIFGVYAIIAVKIGKNPLIFSVVHSIKQLAQLVGIMSKII